MFVRSWRVAPAEAVIPGEMGYGSRFRTTPTTRALSDPIGSFDGPIGSDNTLAVVEREADTAQGRKTWVNRGLLLDTRHDQADNSSCAGRR